MRKLHWRIKHGQVAESFSEGVQFSATRSIEPFQDAVAFTLGSPWSLGWVSGRSARLEPLHYGFGNRRLLNESNL